MRLKGKCSKFKNQQSSVNLVTYYHHPKCIKRPIIMYIFMWASRGERSPMEFGYISLIVIVIVISRFLKRYLKAKRTRAPAYSRALRRIKGVSKGGSREAQVRFPGYQKGTEVGVIRWVSLN